MKVLLTGGGTGGSVTPLLAIVEEIKKRLKEVEFLFIGTRKGIPEKSLVSFYNIPYKGIYSGKLRRYFSWRNFIDPFLTILGFIQSIFIIKKFKPNIILSAGSFVSVPVVLAGWVLKVPSLIHQLDLKPGLANLLLKNFAKRITVTFDESLKNFPKGKTILTGNPIREEILKGNKERAIRKFNLDKNLPTLLIIGGGTGAEKINELVWQTINELVKFCQIIHLVGPSKLKIKNINLKNYHPIEFVIKEIADFYQVSDLIVSRAGMGVLTEIISLAKPVILIPLPDSPQEKNAKYLEERKAAIVLDQKKLTPEVFLNEVKKLILKKEKLEELSFNILKLAKPDANEKIVDEILKIYYNK
jgi:UDP-N-acetylglucosamine--N-acetylmuramyl-(pentapeptide) pyrophosphoryl-undecaprenol N-acetylglucosamine transferase